MRNTQYVRCLEMRTTLSQRRFFVFAGSLAGLLLIGLVSSCGMGTNQPPSAANSTQQIAPVPTSAQQPTPVATSAPQPTPTATGDQHLRTLAGDFLIGYASRSNFWQLPDAEAYQETASSEFNILTPENQLKWESVHPQQTSYSFEPADRHVQFAQAHGMQVHGHTLVWHSQNPGWLTKGSWTADSLTSVLNDHIDTVVGHYQGQIAIWDVVNEAFDEDGSWRESLWYKTLGEPYIEQAFRRARAADPGAVLLYNDYNIETINGKSDAVYALAQDFKRRGVPIDGIGFQMHITGSGLNLDSLARNMQRFADLGLAIYITEMDVRVSMPPSSSAFDKQATIYRDVLDRCLLQPACKGLQVWGFTDKYSWVPDFFSGQGAALIFDEQYQPKPGYFALQSRLRGDTGLPDS
jgi:endo-1,4-beta-xylanase